MLNNTTTSCTTLLKLTKYLQKSIKADIKTLAVYLVKESALEVVQAVLDKISNMYNKHVQQKTTKQAISQLYAIV